jgi:hypothetical protein
MPALGRNVLVYGIMKMERKQISMMMMIMMVQVNQDQIKKIKVIEEFDHVHHGYLSGNGTNFSLLLYFV